MPKPDELLGELSQWLRHDDITVINVLSSIIFISSSVSGLEYFVIIIKHLEFMFFV